MGERSRVAVDVAHLDLPGAAASDLNASPFSTNTAALPAPILRPRE